MLKIVNAFIKEHRQELGLKGYSKMKYLEKLKYLEGKVKGTKYEREIGKLTKPRVDEGIKKVLEKSGRGKNVRVKRDKERIKKEKFEKAVKDLRRRVPVEKKEVSEPSPRTAAESDPEIKQIEEFLDSFEFKTKAQESKFKRIFNAIKDKKNLDMVDGTKPFKVKINGNKINLEYFAKNIAKEGEPIEKTKSSFTLKSK